MAEYIINKSENEKAAHEEESTDEATCRILKAAANLIKAEIRDQTYTNEYYPTPDDIAAQDWIRNNLRHFLQVLIKVDVKVESIDQAKSSTITSLTPLLFGSGVELDHVFGSKWLLDHLARLGFSVTSDEVKLYKQSILMSNSNVSEMTNHSDCSFAQWSADNVDNNTATLDGTKTFHGMGVIVSVTPVNTNIRSQAIKRLKKKQLVDDLVKSKGIPITEFTDKLESFPKFKPYKDFKELVAMDYTYDMI